MKKMIVTTVLLSLTLCLLGFATAYADDRADAVKLVKDVKTYLEVNGLEKTLDVLNDPKGQFMKGDLYVFSYDLNGFVLAVYFKPALIGQNVMEVPDAKGKKFRKEMIERAKTEGSGWVDYYGEHPKTKLLEEKTTYFERAGDVVLGCGIYKK